MVRIDDCSYVVLLCNPNFFLLLLNSAMSHTFLVLMDGKFNSNFLVRPSNFFAPRYERKDIQWLRSSIVGDNLIYSFKSLVENANFFSSRELVKDAFFGFEVANRRDMCKDEKLIFECYKQM